MALLRQCLQELRGREAESIIFLRDCHTDVWKCDMRETPSQRTSQAPEICMLLPHQLLKKNITRPIDESSI